LPLTALPSFSAHRLVMGRAFIKPCPRPAGLPFSCRKPILAALGSPQEIHGRICSEFGAGVSGRTDETGDVLPRLM
jgi:hypothetical protein